MTDDESAAAAVENHGRSESAPSSTGGTRRGLWKWVAIAAVVLLAFVAGLYFPRSWLPGDFATHLPSSCSSTIARTRHILSTQIARADPRGVEAIRDLLDERPDCFTDQDRKLFDAPSSTAAREASRTTVLHVEALASAHYDKTVYEVPAGPVEIRFKGAAGILFTFDDSRFRHCLLATDGDGPHACRVNLTAGDYLVYDSVPGHQQAGYEATIRVK
jgi:hypothetical protein